MTLVVDASVAIKWFIKENDREQALSIFDLQTPLVSPELFRSEFANILWKKIRRAELNSEQADILLQRVDGFVTIVSTSPETTQIALQYAVALDNPVYDCVYLALAEQLGTKLVTGDDKLINKLTQLNLSHLVMPLGSIAIVERRLLLSDAEIKRISDFAARYNDTIANVYNRVKSPGPSFSFVKTADLQPAWDSPSRVTLERQLKRLSDTELLDLIALGWLGRGYDGINFSTIRAQAEQTFADGPTSHLSYIISVLQYVPSGLVLLRVNPLED